MSKRKKKNRRIPIQTLVIFLLIVGSLSVFVGYVPGSNPVPYFTRTATEPTTTKIIGSFNPSIIYCQGLGYQYSTLHDTCIFPDNTQCNSWEFLEGFCGEKYSWCAKNGYDQMVKSDGKNPYSTNYAVCMSNGKEIGSVTLLTGL